MHPRRPESTHQLLEIGPDFLDIDAVKLSAYLYRVSANLSNLSFNGIRPFMFAFSVFSDHLRVRKFVRKADEWREGFATAVADPKYRVLGERKVQFKVAASVHFEDWNLRNKEVCELKPRNPRWSMVSFFTKGWNQSNSDGAVAPKPKRNRFFLGIDEFCCYAKANEDGTLSVGYKGLQDVRRLFQE